VLKAFVYDYFDKEHIKSTFFTINTATNKHMLLYSVLDSMLMVRPTFEQKHLLLQCVCSQLSATFDRPFFSTFSTMTYACVLAKL